MNYVTLAIPFFILLMGVEWLYGHLRHRQTYRLNDTVNSLSMGTLSRLNGMLKLGFSGIVFQWLVGLLGVETLATDQLWLWVAAFVAYDFCYYWKHRMGHEWRIMWASHAAHHQSEEYNLSTALRQTGTDYIGFVFYLPLYLAGLPVEVVVTVGSLNLIYQFWVHTEHVRRLGPLEWVMVTPSNHRVHHARNPEYIDRNYGGVFIIWDRMFGTFRAEDDNNPCVYGITRGLKSWNPLWANFHVWWETLLISIRTERAWDKLRVWFKGPGWYPDDMKPAAKPEWQYPKFDPCVSRFAGVYSFLQYWLLTGFGLALLFMQDQFPRSLVLALFFWFCISFYAIGCWLEGRRFAEPLDWARLAVLGGIAAMLPLADVSASWSVALAVYVAASAVMLSGRHLLPDRIAASEAQT